VNIVLPIEHRFWQTSDGRVWTDAAFAESYFRRYLDVFQRVVVVARVRAAPVAALGWLRADGENISFVGLPYYVGPTAYLRHAFRVHRVMAAALSRGAGAILRVPSQLAAHAALVLRGRGQPYGVEVVSDPLAVFARGAVSHPARAALRWWYWWESRRLCHGAAAASYVTERALQGRYPVCPDAYTVACSDVELPADAFVQRPRDHRGRGPSWRVVTVGSLEQPYKGVDTLLEAVACQAVSCGRWRRAIPVGT
jgi:phosphatidylinositol alpha-1,6-mannosyltransferase